MNVHIFSSLRFVENCPLVKKDQYEKAKSMGYLLQKGVGTNTFWRYGCGENICTACLFSWAGIYVCVRVEMCVLMYITIFAFFSTNIYYEQVIRTNCVDCLDRTNGGQFAVAMKFLAVSLVWHWKEYMFNENIRMSRR